MAIVAPDGRWLTVNRALCETVGYSEAELLGLTFQDITHPDDLEQDLELLRRMLRGELTTFQLEKRYVHKHGRHVPILLTVSLVRDAGGAPRYFVSQMQDMTERRALEERLRQAAKMEAVGRLAGGVAHDFNNLLTAITCSVSLVSEGLAPDDPARADVEEIRAAADRAAELTRKLLAFSRQQMLRPTLLDLNEVVRGIERLLQRVLGGDVAVHAALEPALARVHADAGQVEQVLMNLAVNAHDAMPGGGALVIATANVSLDAPLAHRHGVLEPGAYVTLAVRDTGHGMDEPTLARLFEPFFTTKEVGKGTGLGLATVHGIVHQSGGQIVVESAPRRGTTFTIYLPARERVEAVPALPARELRQRLASSV
jgi:PAS domain S-box-containing protein